MLPIVEDLDKLEATLFLTRFFKDIAQGKEIELPCIKKKMQSSLSPTQRNGKKAMSCTCSLLSCPTHTESREQRERERERELEWYSLVKGLRRERERERERETELKTLFCQGLWLTPIHLSQLFINLILPLLDSDLLGFLKSDDESDKDEVTTEEENAESGLDLSGDSVEEVDLDHPDEGYAQDGMLLDSEVAVLSQQTEGTTERQGFKRHHYDYWGNKTMLINASFLCLLL